jgi:hypothetical protein
VKPVEHDWDGAECRKCGLHKKLKWLGLSLPRKTSWEKLDTLALDDGVNRRPVAPLKWFSKKS